MAWWLHRGASERRTLWAELEPWGAAGLTDYVAEHAGPQLKRRSERCTSEQQSPLPSSSSLPFSFSAHSQPNNFFILPYHWKFLCEFWTKHAQNVQEMNKKIIIAFLWTSELFQGHIVTWKFFVLQINERHILANCNKQMLKKKMPGLINKSLFLSVDLKKWFLYKQTWVCGALSTHVPLF